jgi:hypothetical protein
VSNALRALVRTEEGQLKLKSAVLDPHQFGERRHSACRGRLFAYAQEAYCGQECPRSPECITPLGGEAEFSSSYTTRTVTERGLKLNATRRPVLDRLQAGSYIQRGPAHFVHCTWRMSPLSRKVRCMRKQLLSVWGTWPRLESAR